jgi:hypothetical protein
MKTSRHQPQVVILCEDNTHYHFARKYLQCRGFKKIRKKMPFKGGGSGEQYVREHYAQELKAYRSQMNHLNIALVVVIDADMNSIEERIKSLDDQNPQKPRSDIEKIAIFVPKRNIETWFHYLDGHDCDEEKSYKSLHKNSRPSQFAKKLHEEICSQELPDDAPPSLFHACQELKRLQIVGK